ncbi:hypothetical protein AWW67_13180 [Roseivirga seohaensis]|uniref:HTH LytTR-type domain-containing protein n=1 Tax=Roseivirga seohaensis TaxID=1914963 RepID=A0A150XKT2_9BACT|nr:LytTR family DNA-binding domain-containing protein [Roseivirga seohaensis]KYG79323.1 hypothetical protein AWW67_13180 [Roseivirga seohaensis]
MATYRPKVSYNDLYFRLMVAVIGALLVTEFGGNASIFDRLLSKYFYQEFFSSLLIALTLIECIARATRYLDSKYDWEKRPVMRTVLQIILGVALPGLIDFFMAAIYFKVFGLSILKDTNYMVYAFPYIMIMLVLFNLYYLSYYFFLRSRQISEMQKQGFNKASEEIQTIMVHQGSKHMALKTEDICYVQRENSYNYLHSYKGDSYLTPHALDDLQKMLPSRMFFRVNRQTIVHYKALKHFEPASYGKLELFLSPPVNKQIFVSQRRARGFRAWMEMPR